MIILYLLLLLLLLSNNVFGLINGINMPNISLGGIGTLYLSDVVFVIMIVQLVFVRLHPAAKRNYLSNINCIWLNSFLLYIFLHACYGYFEDGLVINQILKGLRYFAFYFVLYSYLENVRTENSSNKLFFYLVTISLITAMVSFYQAITGVEFTGAKVEPVSLFGFYRTYQIGNQLILLVILLLFAKLLSARNQQSSFVQYLVLALLFGALLTSYSRSLIGLTLIAMVFIWTLSLRPKSSGGFLSHISPVVVTLTVGFLLIYVDGLSFLIDVVSFRLTEAIEDLSGLGGTFGFRIGMLYDKWGYLYDNGYLLFGNGFESINIVEYSDEDKIYAYLFGADNDVANILVLFGLVGMGLLIGLVFSFIRLAILGLKYAKTIEQYNVLLALVIFNIVIMALSLFSRSFSTPGNVVSIVLSWGIIVNTVRFSRYNNIKYV